MSGPLSTDHTPQDELRTTMTGLTVSRATQLSELLRDGEPLIAVSFADRVPEIEINSKRKQGLDVAELRIDRYSAFDEEYVLEQVKRFATFPTIATIRTADEGGKWKGTEPERLHLFEAVLPYVHAVDVELAATEILPELVEAAKAQHKVVIISNHNLDHTPKASELEKMAADAKSLGADYVKLSSKAKSPEDITTLAAFTAKNAGLGLIVVAMDLYGPLSRLFFPALGSRLTYASATDKAEVYGQLPFGETFEMMMRLYPQFRDKKINELQILDGA
jgi:3-dehydroquinate dehydratase I